MRAAAVDIGTNTTLALLAEADDAGGLHPLKDQLTVNRLGEALRTENRLSREVILLNVDLLNEIVRDFRRDGAEDFVLCGTSALRRAQNRQEFVTAVQEIVGVRVEILSGREEAALTFSGGISQRDILPHERVCVMDMGGGSTEIIEGRGLHPGTSFSMDFGSAYLTNEFFTSDPPTAVEEDRLRKHLQQRLPALVRDLRVPDVPWVLVGGTVVTLAIMKAGLRWYDPASISGSMISSSDIEAQRQRFSGKTALELQNLPGMPVGRGKTILAGTILLQELFKALQITEGIVSERGLRHGIWLARFGRQP